MNWTLLTWLCLNLLLLSTMSVDVLLGKCQHVTDWIVGVLGTGCSLLALYILTLILELGVGL